MVDARAKAETGRGATGAFAISGGVEMTTNILAFLSLARGTLLGVGEARFVPRPTDILGTSLGPH